MSEGPRNNNASLNEFKALFQTDVKGSDVLDMVDRYVAVIQDTKCDVLDTNDISHYDNQNLCEQLNISYSVNELW